MDSPSRSIRPHRSGEESVLVIGGEDHRVGEDGDTSKHYKALEAWAHEQYGVQAVDYRWSAQDYETLDDVPYIGRLEASLDFPEEGFHFITREAVAPSTAMKIVTAGHFVATAKPANRPVRM